MRRLAGIFTVSLVLVACATSQAPSPSATASPTPTATPSPTAAPTDEPAASPEAPSPSPSPSPGTTASPVATGGLEGLLAAIRAPGAEIEPVSVFDGTPLSPHGTQLCLEGETVRAYIFSTSQAAAEAAALIDPTDPSNVGTAIVEWNGTPRFWLRDTVLVLYLGDDDGIEAMLVGVLGEPFASGAARGLRLDEGCDVD